MIDYQLLTILLMILMFSTAIIDIYIKFKQLKVWEKMNRNEMVAYKKKKKVKQ